MERTPARERPLLAILGPTAVGKTEVAILAARTLGGEIISADSMAVYRGLDIGTAKPTPSQREQAVFHVIDAADPTSAFNAAEFRRHAVAAAASCRARGKLPIIAGGTGLYVRALLDGYGLAGIPANSDVRAELEAEVRSAGVHGLHQRLAAIDPPTAARLHPNDRVRIVRALEVWHLTGVPLSVYIERDRRSGAKMPVVRVGLSMSMDVLDARINDRVERMFEAGLVAEVRGLLDRGVPTDAPAMRALGYRETVEYLMGAMPHEACVSLVQRNTRRYARRQMTWFRGDTDVRWLDVTASPPDETVGRTIDEYEAGVRRIADA